MDFQKKNWQFRDLITEDELNRMEDGIEEGITKAEQAQQTADGAATAAANAQSDIDAHLNDNERHVTQAEKNTWNNKISKSGDTMTGDLTINKSVPLLELIHEATGTSVAGGLIMRNVEQDIWRVGATSSLGHFYIESFTGNINLRSASYRYGLRGPSEDVSIVVHDAHPEGSVSAAVGTICLRTDSGSHAKLYVKHSGTGSTGWVEVLHTGNTTNIVNQEYEVGSWTPVLRFGGSTSGISYTFRAGQYTRIANVVYWSFDIALSSKGSASGSADIAGLPFVREPVLGYHHSIGRALNITIPSGRWLFGSITSTALIYLYTSDGSRLTSAEFANNSSFSASGFYFI